jgi:uncharacterized phage protein gp47/JayE
MSFQIKDFVSIVAAILNHARATTTKISDFAPGSVARTLMEAPAVEIEELYLQMFLGLRDAIPTATFQSFGFDKLPAKRAFGYVSVSSATPLAQAIAIPAGAVFATSAGLTYTSTQAVTWPAGSTLVRVPVQASTTGLVGNTAAGTITAAPLFPASSGFTVSNALIENGRDVELDLEREARFADFVQALSRGTQTACLYAAKSAVVLDADGNIDQFVTRTGYSEEPGVVRIYLYSNRGVPSAELLAAAQLILDGSSNEVTGEIVPGFRAAGVDVSALPMAERAVSMSVQVEMMDGYTLGPAINQALSDIYSTAIRGVPPSQTLYLGDLVAALLAAPGVLRVVPATSSNIECGASEALVPGTLTVTAL